MPLMSWATHVLQWPATEGSEAARRSEPHKPGPSSDRRLQPACVKSESLVIAGQHTAVNTFPGACVKSESLVIAGQHTAVNTFPGLVHTARHTTKVSNTQSRWDNRKESAV